MKLQMTIDALHWKDSCSWCSQLCRFSAGVLIVDVCGQRFADFQLWIAWPLWEALQSQLLFIIMWVWKYLQYTTKNFFILRTRKEKSHKNTTMTHFFRTFPHDIPHLPLPLLVPISRPQKPFRNQETLHPHPKWLWFASLKTVPSLAKEAVVPVGPFTSLAWRFGGFFTRFGLATKPGSHNCYLKIVWENHSRGLKSNWIKAINYSIY